MTPTKTHDEAIALVSKAVRDLSQGGLELADLPETPALASSLDELADAIDNADSETIWSDITNLAQDIAADLIYS